MNEELTEAIFKQISKNVPVGEAQHEETLNLIKSGNVSNVIERLVTIKPRESGGRFALAGFYYQFLVAIEYFTEMLDGKWDFVAVELHEDIVCAKGNTLRFIQVKSSHEPEIKVAQLVDRSLTKVGKKEVSLNDSWLDKLFHKDLSFDQYDVQYELVTSFPIPNSGPLSVKDFTENNNFEFKVQEAHPIFRNLNKACFQRVGKELKPFCHTQLKKRLQNFRVTKKLPFAHLEDFEYRVLSRLTDVICALGKLDSHVGRLTESDLYELLGLLVSRCARMDNSTFMLLITSEEAKTIALTLLDRIRHAVDKDADTRGDISIIDEIFRGINNTLSETSIGALYRVKHLTDEYYEYLRTWLSQKGTLRSMIGRYKEGKSNSRLSIEMSNTDKHDILKDLIRVSLLFGFEHESISQIDDQYEFLLVKKIDSKLTTCHVHLGERERFEDGVDKLRSFIGKAHKSQKLLLMKSKPKVLMQGQYKEHYKSNVSTIVIQDIQPEIGQLGDNHSVAKVHTMMKVYSTNSLSEAFSDIHELLTLEDLRRKIETIWCEYEVTI